MGHLEYRIVVKRKGVREKSRIYRTRKGAERRLALFDPEPWAVYGKQPDELDCCDGSQCFCGGFTVREASDSKRARMPALEYVRIEARQVGDWTSTEGCR